MAIAGITNVTFAYGVLNTTLSDFINEKFSGKLVANTELRGAQSYLHIKDTADNELFTITVYSSGGSNTIQAKNSSGNLPLIAVSSSNSCKWDIYSCSNGFLIRTNNSSNEAWAFIAFNDDGTIIYGTSPSVTIGNSPTSFDITTWDTPTVSTTATSQSASSTALLNLVYNGEYGTLSIAEHGYFALYSQYPHTAGILNINATKYISNGWFVIED